MAQPFKYPEKPLDRGKVLDAGDAEAARRNGAATRTSTATAFRTGRFPATGMPAYFTRGSGHNETGQYSERPDDYSHNVDRLARKFETARAVRAAADRRRAPDADIGSSATASSHWAIDECRDQLRGESGIRTGYLRLRAYPFTERARRLHRPLRARLRRRAEPRRADAEPAAHGARAGARPPSCGSVLHYNGLPIDARSLTDEILVQEGQEVAPANVGRAPASRPAIAERAE